MDGFGMPSQDSPSLADMVVGVTTKAVMDFLGDDGEACTFPKIRAYLQRFAQVEACVRGAADVGTFIEASPRKSASVTFCPYSKLVQLVPSLHKWNDETAVACSESSLPKLSHRCVYFMLLHPGSSSPFVRVGRRKTRLRACVSAVTFTNRIPWVRCLRLLARPPRASLERPAYTGR